MDAMSIFIKIASFGNYILWPTQCTRANSNGVADGAQASRRPVTTRERKPKAFKTGLISGASPNSFPEVVCWPLLNAGVILGI